MPESIREAVQHAAGSAATALEGAVSDALGLRDAVEGARLEAERSDLPGVNDGGPGDAYRHLLITGEMKRPGDAYRHLLITGEMKRRYGPTLAQHVADGHEFVNNLTRSPTERDREMDIANNSIAADVPEFETWKDVVAWARGKIVEAAPHDGDGQDGRAFWYEKQPSDWRPDFTGVPITRIEKGGPEHGYDADQDDSAPAQASPRASISADPLDRPVASWTEDDVRTILSSPAYLRPQHPRRGEAARKVRAWFERRFGTGPVAVDATGRAIRSGRATAGRAGACPVPVRTHSREGGKVEVGAYCRSVPAA